LPLIRTEELQAIQPSSAPWLHYSTLNKRSVNSTREKNSEAPDFPEILFKR